MDHKLGAAHTVREEQDVLFIVFVGNIEPKDMQGLLAIISGVVARYGRYGTVIDTRKMGSLTPEARRIVTQWPGVTACYGNAVFGEGLITRVMLTMAARTIQVLNSQSFAAVFVQSEAEARAWLTARGASAAQ